MSALFEPLIHVNYLAVLVAAIAAMAFGMLWYGPLFGRKWVALMQFTPDEFAKLKERTTKKSYILALVGQLVMAFTLACLFATYGISGVNDPLLFSFSVWIGFVATTMFSGVLWEGKPWKLYVLNIIHWLVVLLVMGVILGVWQ